MVALGRAKHNKRHVSLGEPLPLPYEIVDSNMELEFKNRADIGTASHLPQPIQLKKRSIIQSPEYDTSPHSSSHMNHIPAKSVPMKPVPRVFDSTGFVKTRQLIMGIQTKIERLAELLKAAQVDIENSELEHFDRWLAIITENIEENRSENMESEEQTENTIFEELEKIQQSVSDNSKFNKVTLTVILMLITAFFLTSYSVSGLSYNYCYYYC